ncbi:MAG: winged helix-turn-helix domain-containing protein [Nanoarchaeota archaeon]|jgi:predicted transcriptional regulator|nr:winged helix-turn-helix domain-containing protein [Nanoarchaeota archaeon]
MNIDLFLGEKRWEILTILAKKPSSPIELSEQLSTTVSYVSQQLKLLEVSGIIYKTRTGAAEKGKPRNVYSLTQEMAQLSILTKDVAEKKLLYLTAHHKAILNIWMVADSTLHYPIEKLFWKLDEYLGKIEGVYLEENSLTRVLVLSGSKEVKQKVNSFIKTLDKQIDCSFITKGNLSTLSLDSILPLYDPENILGEIVRAKGEQS